MINTKSNSNKTTWLQRNRNIPLVFLAERSTHKEKSKLPLDFMTDTNNCESTDFSLAAIQARRQWKNTFQLLREINGNLESHIL